MARKSPCRRSFATRTALTAGLLALLTMVQVPLASAATSAVPVGTSHARTLAAVIALLIMAAEPAPVQDARVRCQKNTKGCRSLRKSHN